jgi:acylphosphatase
MESFRYIVEGRVQGVGFRYFVLRQAQRFGVVGWVRNLDNGAVEIRAEGDAEKLDRFLENVRSGPSFSYVTGVDVRRVAGESFDGFRIKR